jgi:DNA-binding MarR family transcriptional regulator
MTDLAERARLSKQTMTTLVRLLEREGLVRRDRHPEDGRAFRISLTDRARRFQPVADKVLADLDRLVRTHVSERQLQTLESALRKVMQL